MKIVTVVGTRPQFIKAATVSRAIAEHNKLFTLSSREGGGKFQGSHSSTSSNVKNVQTGALITEVIVHTGQHYDENMSAIFFEEMYIPKPDHFLDIHGLSHGVMTGQMLEKIEGVLIDEKPDLVLVYGDTNTTLAGALGAAKLHIPVAHVEAGLRSFNRRMPEEINRVLTDHVSTILFCPTKQAIENLKAEGIADANTDYGPSAMSSKPPQKVVWVGDVMLDAALYYKQHAKKPQFVPPEQFILATIHRAENTEEPERLKSIFTAFEKICQEIPIILPLHPRTKKIMEGMKLKTSNFKLQLVDPVSYLEILYLLKRCRIVMTDSGGLQKESYFFGKPCVTLRDETEWVELVEHGCNSVTGSDTECIYREYKQMIKKQIDFDVHLYGEGEAGRKIVNILTS